MHTHARPIVNSHTHTHTTHTRTTGKPWDPWGLATISERNKLGINPNLKWLQESEVGPFSFLFNGRAHARILA